MEYINAALRGDIQKAAELSFECIMCGLCAARCPAEIVQYHIGILARRLYARHIVPEAPDLPLRVKEIAEGAFEEEFESLTGAPEEELIQLYKDRDIEPV